MDEDIKRLREILEKLDRLSVCEACIDGRDMIVYREICDACNGTGKVSLIQEALEIVREKLQKTE
jgi:RecJ-like exonuclease